MTDHTATLRNFPRRRDHFVGFDSDGCVFDGMEIKHKECFCPAYIKHFGLQAVSGAARQVWEFVNLYSRTRGTNRFPALALCLDLLQTHPQVVARGVQVPRLAGFRAWLAEETSLGTPALAAAVERTGDADLACVLAWNAEVNAQIRAMCHGIPPFPGAAAGIAAAAQAADVMVVSQASHDALMREWQEHDLLRHVALVAGQEMGTKAEHLRHAAVGKYAPTNILLCGDALGDRDAALANGVCFYPIIPGREDVSWQRFRAEALPRFLAGEFDAAYQQALLEEFGAVLPAAPPWESADAPALEAARH